MADDDKRQRQLEIAKRAGDAIRLIPKLAEMEQRLHMVRGQMSEVVAVAIQDHPQALTKTQLSVLIDCLALMTVTLHPSQERRGIAKAAHEFGLAPIWQKIATVLGILTLLGAVVGGAGYAVAHTNDIRVFVVQALGGQVSEQVPTEPDPPDLLGNSSNG